MRVTVDQRRCLGTGFCEAVSDELFFINREGQAEVRISDLDNGLVEAARTAARSCPTQAISVEE
jgi:ferredoxin